MRSGKQHQPASFSLDAGLDWLRGWVALRSLLVVVDGLMQIETSVASEPRDGPVYRWLGVNVVFIDKTLGAPRPLGALLRDYDVHCEEGACSLSHDICRDSGDGVYEMQLVRSPWSSPPPSCNQCVLILTTAPRPSPTTDCTNSCSFSLSV